MLSDNEDENAIDKNFAIQNNLGDKLKGDIFTPKNFHSFKPKKINYPKGYYKKHRIE